MKQRVAVIVLVLITIGTVAMAQGGPGSGAQGMGPMGGGMGGPMHMRGQDMGPMGPGMGGPGMMGKWWKNSELVRRLGLTDAQVQQIENIFQERRLQLIDLHAALEKQEAILDPLVNADRPDEAKVTAQIDKVAQARANLEKANAQMLLGIRRVLTVEQWKQLQSQCCTHMMHGPSRSMVPAPSSQTMRHCPSQS